jgi:steroid delta-isomerase-like uncharacterized protein
MTDNTTAARRVVEEAFNEGRLETLDELMSADVVGHDAALPEPTRGVDAQKEQIDGYRRAFPDIHMTIEDLVAADDTVVTRWTGHGTNTGPLWHMEPTGKEATVTGITIDRFADGRIVESWTNWDTLGMMQQLGVIPVSASA